MKETALKIVELLEQEYPEALCSLEYEKDYELLFATRLAAQCTDERVNKVTPTLYSRYPSLEAQAEAKVEDVEEIIRSCGFFHTRHGTSSPHHKCCWWISAALCRTTWKIF